MRIGIQIIGFWLLAVLPLAAQQMRVDEFVRLKKAFLKPRSVETDKRQAILDLYTNETGFTFVANGSMEVQAEEGEGKLTLFLPHRTTFLVIKHPDYGQYAWKIPKKGLKKKKRYRAYLDTFSPDKEYKIGKQWAVFYIQPNDAIVYMDSLMSPVRTGKAQFYLPLGRHAFRVEAPFYETVEDTLCLTDSLREEKRIELRPFYSYLTVKTKIPNSRICLDGQEIGLMQATSGRLDPGTYRLTVVQDSLCFYDSLVEVGKSEKRVVDLTGQVLKPQRWNQNSLPIHSELHGQIEKMDAHAIDSLSAEGYVFAPIHLIASDEETEIWINREWVGDGEWEGPLAMGFYAITTRKEGLESNTSFLWVDDSRPQTLDLAAPQSAYGMLNVRSNEIDAEIWINDLLVGTTPCIIPNLPADRSYVVRLQKSGYKDAVRTVRPRGNDQIEVSIDLKKK